MADAYWRDNAACRETDPEVFYPSQGEGTGLAMAICGYCPVRTECLADALGHGDQFGIWGGQTVNERRNLRRRERRSKSPISLRGQRL